MNKGFSKLKVTDVVEREIKPQDKKSQMHACIIWPEETQHVLIVTKHFNVTKSIQTSSMHFFLPLNFNINVTLRSPAVIPTAEKTDTDLKNDTPSYMQTEVCTAWDLTEHWVTYL